MGGDQWDSSRRVAEKPGIKTLSASKKPETSKTANPEWLTLHPLEVGAASLPP